MIRQVRPLGLVAVGAALALIGCGGGGGGSVASDQRLADAVALEQSDLPGDGWQSVRVESQERCAPPRHPPSARGRVREFYLEEFTAAASASAVYDNADEATAGFRDDAHARLDECYATFLRRALESAGVRVLDVLPAPLLFERLGDESLATSLVARARKGTRRLRAYADVVRIREGRAIVLLVFTSAIHRFPVQTEQAVAGKVLARVPAELRE